MTPKQERFIVEYLIDLNATQSAIRAGYSSRTATAAASRLLANVKVSEEIAKRKASQLQRADLSAQSTLEVLRCILHADPADFENTEGQLKRLRDISPEARKAIAGFEVVLKNAEAGDRKTDRVLKVKMWDKTRALEMAMKHFALLAEKVDATVRADELTALLLAGRERAARES